MTDQQRDADDEQPSIPESGPEAEPVFDEPSRPAPTVIDPPGRSGEL